MGFRNVIFVLALSIGGCAAEQRIPCNVARAPAAVAPRGGGLEGDWTWRASHGGDEFFLAGLGSKLLRWREDRWEYAGQATVHAFSIGIDGRPQVLFTRGERLCVAREIGGAPLFELDRPPMTDKNTRYVRYLFDGNGVLHAFAHARCVAETYAFRCDEPFHAQWIEGVWRAAPLEVLPEALLVDRGGLIHAINVQGERVTHSIFENNKWRDEEITKLAGPDAWIEVTDFRAGERGFLYAVLAHRLETKLTHHFAELTPDADWRLSQVHEGRFDHQEPQGQAVIDRDGRVHVVLTVEDGLLKHAVRGSDGSWELDVVEKDEEKQQIEPLVLNSRGEPVFWYQSYDYANSTLSTEVRVAVCPQ